MAKVTVLLLSLQYVCWSWASPAATTIAATSAPSIQPGHSISTISIPTTTPVDCNFSPLSPTPSSYSLQYTFAPPPASITSLLSLWARQECFNDQGFSVDCATWTGYRYTWGPPGNPYEGGPGEGGGSGGGGSNSGVVSESAATFVGALRNSIKLRIISAATMLALLGSGIF